MKGQISIYEYYSLPAIPSCSDYSDITEIQIDKIYKSMFDLKCHKKKIESKNVKEVINVMNFCTKYGGEGMGIGWEKDNPTIVNIDKKGIEFDYDGVKHSFRKVALLLIQKYAVSK